MKNWILMALYLAVFSSCDKTEPNDNRPHILKTILQMKHRLKILRLKGIKLKEISAQTTKRKI